MNIEDERRVRQIIKDVEIERRGGFMGGCISVVVNTVVFCILLFPLLPIIFEYWGLFGY